MSIARTAATRMASNAPVHTNVAIDARPARKRRTEDDVVPGGAEFAGMAKRRRTIATVKMESIDAMLVGHIDAHTPTPAPAAGGDGKRARPAARTPTRTRAARAIQAGTPPARQTTGFRVRATLLDLDAPATSHPLPTHGNPAFPRLLNLDWPGTALPLNLSWPATAPPRGAAAPLERGALYARADPLYANVDPMLVAAYEQSRPRMPLDETRQFNPAWVTYDLPAPLELPGTDLSVLRPYGVTAHGDADAAPGYLHAHAHEDADRKLRVPLNLAPRSALDGREAFVSAPLHMGGHMSAEDLANLDPALWGEDWKPYVPLEEKRAATDAPLDFEVANTHTPHAGNIAQLLAPAHADAPEDERTPYVPFHEKLEYITEWRRRVATEASAPAPLELPAPDAVVPGAYYRADAVGIPVGDPRTRDWVPLPPYAAALDELVQYGAAPYEMPPMSPKTKREFEEFLAAGPGPFADDTPTGPRACVDMGLLTPGEEPQVVLDAAEHLALLDALLLDLQS